MAIRVEAELGLRALGSPSTLAQVLTNVLANCARHAPGSPIHIQAGRAGDTVRIRVSDFGPGVARGAEQHVFREGVRGERSEGVGLGLHISTRLLVEDGGRMFIQPSGRNQAGCTVVLELQAAVSEHAMLEQTVPLDVSP
jgi:two-component system OmpR family sensor kinase